MSPPNTARPGRILLVDDNQLGLTARKAVLEDLGYDIVLAKEGAEALDHFGRQQFDLVITDYKMPRMNGLELIQKLRRLQPDLPIVLISGYADALGLTEKGTGADVVIAKSANEVQQMTRVVTRLLRRPTHKKPAASQKSRYRVQSQSV